MKTAKLYIDAFLEEHPYLEGFLVGLLGIAVICGMLALDMWINPIT